MIPSYFKIEILAIQDEFVLLGHKGLNFERILYLMGFCSRILLSYIRKMSLIY